MTGREAAGAKDLHQIGWLELGCGLLEDLGAGSKAWRLDHAMRKGLPVPRGLVLTDALWRRLLAVELLTADREGVHRGDTGPFLAELRLPDWLAADDVLAVRSAFACEDGTSQSQAGRFVSVLRVRRGDATELVQALARVWDSSLAHDVEVTRRDVLLMRMVEARHSGVAFALAEHEDDVVEHVAGTAERLVGGLEHGTHLDLPRLRGRERPDRTLEPWLQRLQRLLQGVRSVFGDADWDVEWADDGTTCWLLQVRPVTASLLRDEWFTVANHREILPEHPSRLMSSLIAACAGRLFAHYRAMDARLPRRRLFLELFAGRPRINLSLLTDMMRRWGLPTRLVTDSIGGPEGPRGVGLRPMRLLASAPVLLRLAWRQQGSTHEARSAARRIAQLAAQPRDTFHACTDHLAEAYVVLVHAMMSLTGSMSGPLALLRRCGVLHELASGHRTVTARMFEAQERLRELGPGDPGFAPAWDTYLREYGHRGAFESDVGVPRTHERPEDLLQSLGCGPVQRPPAPLRTLRGLLCTPVWWLARKPLAAREQLRHDAMRCFDAVRQSLRTLAAHCAAGGRLADPDLVFDLTVDELHQLDAGASFDTVFATARRADLAAEECIRLADVFTRSSWRTAGMGAVPDASVLRGLGLTRGVVAGIVWVAADPRAPRPESVPGMPLVLVAAAIDAGWIPLLRQVDAVVVETGGELSHGSILVREVGLPAVTNVRGAHTVLRDGMRVEVDAAAGWVRVGG